MTDVKAALKTPGKSGGNPHIAGASEPRTPAEVPKISRMYIARKALREFSNDGGQDLAAGLTYYGVLAIFPALLALVSLLGIFGQAQSTTSAVLDLLGKFAPASALETLKGPLDQLTHSSAAGAALVIGIVAALWSASGYVGGFSRAMNRIYEVPEGRPAPKLRVTMFLVTVAAVILVAVMAAILALSGPVATALGNLLGLGETSLAIWNIAKWPLLLVLAIVIIAFLYYATPNVRQPRFRWISGGSLIALVAFIVATVGFGIYVGNFSHYNKTYGALGGVIVMLLWFWILNSSLLLGAEFDAETERARELRAGIAAETTIQLPPRGTVASNKRRHREHLDEIRGRVLRTEAQRMNERAAGADRNTVLHQEKSDGGGSGWVPLLATVGGLGLVVYVLRRGKRGRSAARAH